MRKVQRKNSAYFLVPPGEPEITQQPSSAIREMDFITIKCESRAGNPPPTFKWLYQNKSEVPKDFHHERTISEVDEHGNAVERSISILQ